MARYISGIRQTVRQILKDEFVVGTAQVWEDDEIDIHLGQCLEEISQVAPLQDIVLQNTLEESRVLDISGISNLVAPIETLEYPVGSNPRSLINAIQIDSDTIEMDIEASPSAGTSGTLTGTVTFASGSLAVTGSGTAFSTELEANSMLKTSSGTRWYRVSKITSDTALTLAEPCRSGDTGADTADSTAYKTKVVGLVCHKLHTLSEDTSTLDVDQENVLINGTVAYTAQSYVGTMMANIRSDLTLGRALINTVTYGGSPEADYGNYASKELQVATGYLRLAADRYMGLYQRGLRKITKGKLWKEYSRA